MKEKSFFEQESQKANAVRTFNDTRKYPDGFREREDGIVVPERLIDSEPKVIVSGSVNEDMFTKLSNELTSIEKSSKFMEKLDVALASFGGCVYYGFGIYDLLKEFGEKNKVPVRITGYGPIMSMGAFIIQAADERCMPKNSVMRLHPLSARQSGSINYLEFELEQDKSLCKVYTNVVSERVQKSGNTEITPEVICEMMESNSNVGTYLKASEAFEIGLIDKVV